MPEIVKLAELLKQHDEAERELRRIKSELATATATYGRKIGLYGFTVDHLRARVTAAMEIAA